MSNDFRAEPRLDAMHTAVKVRDLQKMLEFYNGVVGLEIKRRRSADEGQESVWLPGVQLVVDESAGPGGSLDHVAIGVDNIEDVCKRLDDAGYEAEQPLSERNVGRHLKMAFYHDPEGNRVEILKYLD
jgi:catechol 2,3-dioxygenase-like lactoylglutathione lyase family enzyme